MLLYTAALPAAETWICPTPFAKFTYTIGPDGFTVSFDTESCDPDLKYSWTFGDGGTSSYTQNQTTPTYIYSTDGTYVVRMTVKNSCGDTYTQEAIIVIIAGSPSGMWVDLVGPTIAAECQDVTYTANVVGGVPPYTYTWTILGYYCNNCLNGACSPPIEGAGDKTLDGGPSKTVHFATTGNTKAHCKVVVTDAMGTSITENWQVKVRPAFAELKIKTIAEPANCGNPSYLANTNILFVPDIDPLFNFDYPTNYYWTFDDNTSYADEHDGGGIYLKSYAPTTNPVTIYQVTLNVCDPNGCMQATQEVTICNPNAPGGSGPPATPQLVVQEYPNTSTVRMDYIVDNNITSGVTVNATNMPACANPTYQWTATLDPEMGLTDPTLFYQASTLCGLNASAPSMPVGLYGSQCWYSLLSNVPALQGRLPWGCVSLSCVMHCPFPSINPVPVAMTQCLLYIDPAPLKIVNFTVDGSCQDYTVSADIQGGGWKKVGSKFTYKDIVWAAYDTRNPEVELTNIFIDVPGDPDKKKINLSNPYFEQFGPRQFVEFLVKLKVQDYANGSVEINELVAFNPFRVHLEEHYTRCPGVQSKFSQYALATGGTDDMSGQGEYNFTWSPPSLMGENPTFTAPAAGITTPYSVTVTNGPGCSITKTTTVTGQPLNLSLYNLMYACAEVNCSRPINPTDAPPAGGSGHYQYAWSPTTYLSDPHIFNPNVQGVPAGQTIAYVLTVTDDYGGCTASSTKNVTGFANEVTLNAPANVTLCYGIDGQINGVEGLPSSVWGGFLYYYTWTSDNPHHTGLENQHVAALPFSSLVTSYPGTYHYTVRYTNGFTGCYKEKMITVTVSPNWTHTGYVPGVRSTVAGSTVDLWGGAGAITGITNLQNVTIGWTSSNPTTTTFYSSSNVPKNGQFVPTIVAPYLMMKVTDNATGCFKDYKSSRYILTDAKPELWVTGDNPVVCLNGDICFDLYFDAHLSDPRTSILLPTQLSVNYQFNAPSGSGQSPLAGTLILTMVNSSGLYKGHLCEGQYFQNTTIISYPNLGAHYLFSASLSTSQSQMFGDLTGGCTCSINPYTIDVQAASSFGNLQTCIYNGTGATGYKIDLGLLPCPSGTSMSTGYMRGINAGDYIEIHPDAGIELYAVQPDGIGHRLLINPCIDPANKPDPGASLTDPPIVDDRGPGMKSTDLDSGTEMNLDIFPNPFTGLVTIRYTLPLEQPDEVSLDLLDFTGKLVQHIRPTNDNQPGYHEIEFDGSALAPGIYLYRLVVGNNGRIIKKVVKVGF